MNKLSKTLLITFLGFFSINPSYAFDLFYIQGVLDSTNSRTIKNQVYGIDLSENSKTLLTEIVLDSFDGSAGMNSFVSPSTGELIITDDNGHKAYSWEKDSWRTIDEELVGDVPLILQKPTTYGERSSNILSIGKNSLKLQETSNQMKLWATDSSGRIAPINITNGTDLQINGLSVQTQIDTNTSNISTNTSNISTNTSNISTNTSNIINLGSGVAGSTALTAALTALPQSSKESKISCGVGSGAYSSRYAVGFGCASRVNERVDINAGGSYVFGGSKSYGEGTLDSGVVKAGFVFKLGKLNNPTQISFNDRNIIYKKISSLEEDNKNLKSKNNEIISQNQKLLARLEKLENIAIKFQSSSEMISVATK